MSETPVRIFAFDAYAARDRKPSVAGAGIGIEPRHVEAMFAVRAPAAPTASGGVETRVLRLGPDEWLVAAMRGTPEISADGFVTDVSHGRAVLRVAGREVLAVLAKGCALDLDPRVFAVGACAQTAIAKINVILDRVAPDAFDIYCPRSYAGSFWHWLTEAAAEYGCNIELG